MDQTAPKETEERKTKRAFVFHGTRWLLFVSLGIGALAIAQYLTGDKWAVLRFNVYVLAVLLWRWGSGVATFVCRLLGLSLDGVNIERFERRDANLSQVSHISEPLIISRNKSGIFIMPVCTTLLCVICFGPSLLTCTLLSEDLEKTCILIFMFSVLLAVAIFSWANILRPGIKIDSQGVAYCDSLGLHSRFIAWPQIASYEVVSRRNVFGEVVDKSLVLQNTKHKKLLRVRFDSRSPKENNLDLDQAIERMKAELA